MKKFLIVFLLVPVFFAFGCGSNSKNEGEESVNDSDNADTSDTEPADSTSDTSDTSDTKPDNDNKTDNSDKDSAPDSDSSEVNDSDVDDEVEIDAECSGSGTICENSGSFTGQLFVCNGSKYEKSDKCSGVSCDGDKCGECVNYTRECRNSEDGKGAVYICKEGKWSKRYDCGDNSCDTEAIDGGDCGECKEGAFKCENGNVPEDFKYITYEGGTFTLPKGFITGLRSKCIKGKWNKLAIDDHENCFLGHLQSNDLPYTSVNGRDVISVYGYDSNGSSSGREYRVTMCKNDVECGECLYSFSYCSGSRWATCHNGEILEQTCQNVEGGNSGCHSANSCYPYSTVPYCNSDSCQNCKSICNW